MVHQPPRPAREARDWRTSTCARCDQSWAGSRWCSAPARRGRSRGSGCGTSSASQTSPIARRTAPDLDVLATALLSDLEGRHPRNFRVTARRADKRFPMPSPTSSALLGARVQAAFGWPVKLDDPELTIRIELRHERRVLLLRQGARRRRPADRRERPRGVPAVGRHRLAGGRVADDAPRLLRAPRPLPQLSDSSTRRRRRRCARSRRCWRGISSASRLYQVPFGQLQRQVVVAVPRAAARSSSTGG